MQPHFFLLGSNGRIAMCPRAVLLVLLSDWPALVPGARAMILTWQPMEDTARCMSQLQQC